MNNKFDINAVFLTLKIASISTVLTLIVAILLVWGMENRSKKLRSIIEMLINLSLFISPTVLGYILIIFLGKRGIIGSYLYEFFNIQVIFSWWAGIVTAFVVSLPLMYNCIKAGFSSLDYTYREAGKEMGASDFQILRLVIIPLIRRNILAGIVLSFGRALGEFGATLMLAGNIPGKTQTMSTAIYSAVERGDNRTANLLLVIVLIISFCIMCLYNYFFKGAEK